MTIRIRPIEPADGPKLVALHESLTDVTRHYRFFSPHPRLTPAEVERFSHVDHVDREALVAVDDDDNVVGVGRFDRTGDDIGEVAFVVTDRLQGQGLGTLLLQRLGEWGAAHGIGRFEAYVLGDNRSMMHVFRKWAAHTSVTFCDGVLHFEMVIPSADGVEAGGATTARQRDVGHSRSA